MHRLLILLVSLMVLTSSCAVKKVLWAQLGMESAIPTNLYPSKAAPILCAGINASFFDVGEVTPNNPVKASLLLALLFVVSFTFSKGLQEPAYNYSDLNHSNTGKVPIYLKLGRLIYYS